MAGPTLYMPFFSNPPKEGCLDGVEMILHSAEECFAKLKIPSTLGVTVIAIAWAYGTTFSTLKNPSKQQPLLRTIRLQGCMPAAEGLVS